MTKFIFTFFYCFFFIGISAQDLKKIDYQGFFNFTYEEKSDKIS